jgi:transposase
MSDAQWQALAPLLGAAPGQPRRRGRPATNLRRTVDAVFWVAAGSGPWHALPPHLGRPGTAHQVLRRWARSGVMHQLLLASERRRAPEALRALGWVIARAFRRISRLLPMRALVDAARRNIRAALPAFPLVPPDPNLSKSTAFLAREAVFLAPSRPAEALGMVRAALAAVRAAQKMLRTWRYK